MEKIYIDAAHSVLSPGAVCSGRNEHRDCLKLARALYDKLSGERRCEVIFCPEEDSPPDRRLLKAAAAGAGAVIIFHRAWKDDTGPSDGARIIVPPDAPCRVLCEAEQLLQALCGASGLRNRGVHLCISGGTHKSLYKSALKRVFLIEAGYIDSGNDNIKYDVYCSDMAEALAAAIGDILKEGNIYENNTAV